MAAEPVLLATPIPADPSAEKVEAAVEVITRVLRLQLQEALDIGRLETILGAARGLEHLVALAGMPIAARAFQTATDKAARKR